MSENSQGQSDRMAPLDGLRGFASLYVIVAHLFPLWQGRGAGERALRSLVDFGWSGVDLFFVLSGFLITGILLRSRDRPAGQYFGVFYGRRFLRVFPLYYAMLTIFLVVVPRLSMFGRLNYFWIVPGNSFPYWAYLSNWPEQLHAGTHRFLCVCWSLAIEEQYYLAWPLIVWLTRGRSLAVVSLGLLAGSALLRTCLFLALHVPAATVYAATFTHLDGIALGSLLAVAWRERDRYQTELARLARLAPVLGLAVLALILYVGLTDPPDQPLAYAPAMILAFPLIDLFYGSLLVRSLTMPGTVKAIFTSRFLRTLGKYSYAAYLFQFVAAWLVEVALAHAHRRFPVVPELASATGLAVRFTVEVAVTYGLAALSWKVFEGPLNAFKDRAPLLNPAPASLRSAALAAGQLPDSAGQLGPAAGR